MGGGGGWWECIVFCNRKKHKSSGTRDGVGKGVSSMGRRV